MYVYVKYSSFQSRISHMGSFHLSFTVLFHINKTIARTEDESSVFVKNPFY